MTKMVTPSIFSGCADNPVFFGATVRSFFSNYNYYKWQISTDGGVSWANTGISGVATPMLNAGQYEYTANYPPFIAGLADNGKRYKIVVATTPGNLGNINCSYTDIANVTTLNIQDCFVLPTGLQNFQGRLVNGAAELGWETLNEQPDIEMLVEKSTDGINFSVLEKIKGSASPGSSSKYHVRDPEKISVNTYYRIRLIEGAKHTLTNTVILRPSENADWSIQKVVNPFNNTITMQVSIPAKGKLTILLTDTYGRMILRTEQVYEKGTFSCRIPVKQDLKKGIYILTVQYADRSENVKLMKQ